MKVSIIIPIYNVAPYIEACLKSVMRQTFQGDTECLLIDDCGTDDSMAIAEKMITAYEGSISFRVTRHERNRGLSAARNTGIDAATGDYIYFLDSDDEVTPDCIEKLMRPIMADASIEMVMGNYTIHADEGCKVKRFELPVTKQQEELTSLEAVRDYYFNRRGFYVYAWNKLVSREFLIQNKLYFKEGLLWEDYLWTFFVVKYLSHLVVMPDATYKYYKRQHSITTRAKRREKAHYMGLAYVEMGHNFTEGEREMEARRYVKGLCSCMADNPTNPVLCEATGLFLTTFRECGDRKNALLLRGSALMSRFALGRWGLRMAEEIVGRIVWR